MRDRGRAPSNWEDDEEDDEGGPSEAAWSGPPAMLADLESIRLKRAVLEKWLLEPFFADLLPGCFVRIGLQIPSTSGPGPSTTLYRAAEVLEVKDLHDISHPPYPFAGKTTSKHLRLVFGEMTAWYQMAPISNGAFTSLELDSWRQVREMGGHPMVTAAQVRAKSDALHQASNYHYSEADITKKVQEELSQKAQQKGGSAMLTTRQRLLAQHGGSAAGGAAPSDLVAKPLKFQRNVFGQAIIEQG